MKKLKHKTNKMGVIEITPVNMSCVIGTCPAVYSIEGEGKLAIVGKRAKPSKLGIASKVGKDEEVVIVDGEMIKQIFEK